MSASSNKGLSTFKFASNVTITATIIVVSIILAAFPGTAVAQTNEDSAAVFIQVEKYQNVWNTRDLTALAEFFTEDADFLMGTQPLIRGRDAIRNSWKNYFNRQEPERRATFIVNSIKMITSDVALVNITSITGGKYIQGAKLPTRKARGTWVLHRQNSDWLITAMRGMPTEEDRIIRKIEN